MQSSYICIGISSQSSTVDETHDSFIPKCSMSIFFLISSHPISGLSAPPSVHCISLTDKAGTALT